MNNRSRKSLLTRAAARSANRKINRGVASCAEYGGLVTGYEDGYKAALRDARKAISAEIYRQEAVSKYGEDQSIHSFLEIDFVRPIR